MVEIVGDYQFKKEDLLGHGAFAIVFRGSSCANPEKTVAIKQIAKKQLNKTQSLLEKEIRVLKELTKLQHENLVALLDFKESQTHVFLVMEYCNGGDLADYLQTRRTLSEDTIAIFFRQIAAGIYACHQRNVVHRDLKPQNILLSHPDKDNPRVQDIVLKIADFGFARFLSDGVMAGTLCGSPMYMAPEVIRSLQYEGKADLWSIGTIMFQCLTGKAPFQASTPQALKQFYERSSNLVPAIPQSTSRDLTDLITRTLKRNPKDRIDFDEFVNHPFLRKSQPVNISSGRTSSSSNISIISSSPLRDGILSDGTEFESNLTRYMSRPFDPIPEHESDVSIVDPPKSKTMLPSSSPMSIHSESPKRTRNILNLRHPLNSPAGSPNFEQILSPKYQGQGPSANTNMFNFDKRNTTDNAPSPNELLPRVETIALTAIENTTPHKERRSSSISQPIPVPTQLHNYEKMQGTRDRTKSFGGVSSGSPYGSPYDDRRPSLDRLRQASIASSSSDLANSISPPNIRFTIETNVLGKSPFNLMPSKNQTANVPKQGIQQTTSNSTMLLNNSPGRSQQTIVPFDDIPNPFFEQENDIDFLEDVRDVSDKLGPVYRRVSTIFGDSKPEGRYSEPEKIADDTLMNSEHHDILDKLRFILQLVDYIMNFAKSRTSPLTEPLHTITRKNSKSNLPKLDRLSHVDQLYKRAEQLTLYVKAMHFLSSAMCLARDTLQSKKLCPSDATQAIVHDLNNKYKQCLIMCKQLISQGEILACDEIKEVQLTADKLLYLHAIEISLNAASSEFFGQPHQSIEPYTEAQILLHSLSQQVSSNSDRSILQQYREGVERRLRCLQNQGLVMANISTTSGNAFA